MHLRILKYLYFCNFCSKYVFNNLLAHKNIIVGPIKFTIVDMKKAYQNDYKLYPKNILFNL